VIVNDIMQDIQKDPEVTKGARKVALACSGCLVLFAGFFLSVGYFAWNNPQLRSFFQTGRMRTYNVPADVGALLDEMAGRDPETGAKAWLTLGTKYTNTEDFLRDLTPALNDQRPIAFLVEKHAQAGNPPGLRYYSTTGQPVSTGTPQARTVGEALILDLWRLEGRGRVTETEQSVEQWWSEFAEKRNLPRQTTPTAKKTKRADTAKLTIRNHSGADLTQFQLDYGEGAFQYATFRQRETYSKEVTFKRPYPLKIRYTVPADAVEEELQEIVGPGDHGSLVEIILLPNQKVNVRRVTK
jgi:hypothetical protein